MAVLEVLLNVKSSSPAWGLSICRDADLGPGTVYPILDRLLERGWLRSWDEVEAHPGRPARRFYEFTGAGRAQALEALEARNVRRARFSLRHAGGAA
ncbi:PadR family transcriptional regulator [Streptomyces malaysiensis]|uniref:PadR family transcriptional regulator n=1 Tax=Streptomyces malaysiensis TaxID=92644 RepID=UPI0034020E35